MFFIIKTWWRSNVTSSLCDSRPQCCASEKKYTTPGVFWRGGGGVWGHTCVGRYLPRKCSCAICLGLEGLGGQSPNPETRESRPLEARRQRTGRWHMTPHNTPQPITNQHGGEDEKKYENKTNQNKRGHLKERGGGRGGGLRGKVKEKRWLKKESVEMNYWRKTNLKGEEKTKQKNNSLDKRKGIEHMDQKHVKAVISDNHWRNANCTFDRLQVQIEYLQAIWYRRPEDKQSGALEAYVLMRIVTVISPLRF